MSESVDTTPIEIHGDRFVPFIGRQAIRQRVSELAESLNRDYEGRRPIFVCVLNGAFMFFADLIREIHIPCEVDFLKLSSYSERKISSGRVTLLKDLESSVKDRHVVLVEDIVDTGLTIDYMKRLIAERSAASMSIVTLLHKPERARIRHQIEYIGFDIPPRFVVGYGLDYAQQARNLPEIFILDHEGSEHAEHT